MKVLSSKVVAIVGNNLYIRQSLCGATILERTLIIEFGSRSALAQWRKENNI